ncbi:glycosyltransferase family 4 protein [Euryarchaeota archaeon]|nr:glycosyltransferase family 4 protein [Euryarchaeota archaeon]MDA8843798.1 glycosyltransferase family 4 protein [Euryarchaeota archaeon]MDA9828551.1 glycosyltransferase family 4 protein [Candidatus Poseidoniaceae archaeon]MDC3236866.1 glycosyltransferase family 4 protein [Candidatus Poseidoniaceae archaeon]
MPKVLHIGPCETPGGMANVMRILAEHPPEGWEAELLSSHVTGSPWAKWRAYRRARQTLIQMLKDPAQRPDIVHLHTAADWSWWRKRRFAQMAHKAGVPNIVHIHSGQFDTWLKASSPRVSNFRKDILVSQSTVVVLSTSWQEKLSQLIGDTNVIQNPLDPALTLNSKGSRDPQKILFLARNDPIKGGEFAQKLVSELRQKQPSLFLAMSGIETSEHSWVQPLGWMTEEQKRVQLSTASILIIPSKFEGQPMVALEALAMGTPVLLSDRIHSLPKEIPRAIFEDLEDWKKNLLHLLSSENTMFDETLLLDYSLPILQEKWKTCYETLLM